jgi:hypothetical protein
MYLKGAFIGSPEAQTIRPHSLSSVMSANNSKTARLPSIRKSIPQLI